MQSNQDLDGWELTDVITRLRRVLRVAVRREQPWEALPMAQVEILQRLRDEPGLRVRDLADRHRLAANTVSTLLRQMTEAGLVSREADPADGRAVTVALTPAGAEALAGWVAAHEHRIEAALAGLSAHHRRRIREALPALRALADRLEED